MPHARPSKASDPATEQTTRASLLAWYALVGAVLLVPMTLPTLAWFDLGPSLMADPASLAKTIALRVFTVVGLAAWAFDLLTRGGRIRHTPIDWLVLAFVAWVGVTTVFSIHVPTALIGKYHRDEGFLAFVNYALIYFLTLQLVDRAARIRTIAVAVFASSVPVAGYGIIQYWGLDPIAWVQDFVAARAFSTFGNPNILAGYLMFTVPVALALALAETRPRHRLAYWAGFYLNLFTLYVTFTRGGWIGGVIAIALVAFIAARHGLRLRRTDLPPAIAVTAGGVVAVLAERLWSLRPSLPLAEYGAQRVLVADPGGVGARLMMWQAALSAAAERPLLGYGPDTFRYVFPAHKPEAYVRITDNIADSPHSYPLQLLVGSGVVGAVLFFAVMGWAAIRSAPQVFNRSSDRSRVILGAFWAASAGYLASLVFGLSLPGVSFLLWIAVAVAVAPTAATSTVRAPSWGRIGATGGIAHAAVLIALQVPLIAADRAFMRSQFGDIGSAGPRYAAEAVRLNPLSHAYREQVGISYFNEALRQLGIAEQAFAQGQDPTRFLEDAERNLGRSERAFLDAIEWEPAFFGNYQYLATLYNLRGDLLGSARDHEAALRVTEEIRAIDPYAMATRVEQAYALHALARADEAVTLLEESLALVPGHERAALLLAGVHEQKGNR
ncbi:MAG TPA: O-antigen ligase family protein, partial [Coriobacteriia bacterium]|nr:O-antigen ligase family protein [Coriobacteriia bacterium]